MVTVNGEKRAVDGQTVSQFLKAEGTPPGHIAVMINEAILSKQEFDTTVFADGDVVEIIGFVGGGSPKR
jgi:sulfur carrier protein